MKKVLDKNSNSTQQLAINESFPSKEMFLKMSNQNSMAPTKRFAHLMLSENELEKMTEEMVNKHESLKASIENQDYVTREGSQLSSITHSDNSTGKHMIFRKRSQGLDKQASVKKNYQSRIGNGKVVADYLPQIKCAKKLDENESRLSTLNDDNSIEPQNRASSSFQPKIIEKVQTCPLTQMTKFDLSVMERKSNEDLDSPIIDEPENEENELLVDDDDSSENQLEDSDESEEDKEEQERKAKELKEIQEWAKANGFQVAVEQPKTQLLKRDQSKKKHKLQQNEAKGGEKSLQPQILKKKDSPQDKMNNNDGNDDWMMNWQSLSIEKEMRQFIPPPCEILEKQYGDNEPIRTGFNQGLIPISIRDNNEHGHFPQGPQIVVTTQNIYNHLKKKEMMNEKKEKSRKRNPSKDITSILKKSTFKEPEEKNGKIIDQLRSKQQTPDREKESNTEEGTEEDRKDQDIQLNNIVENEADKVQQVIHQAMLNSETSLRHLFYLEYKKQFTDGSQNPIVYSKYGKMYYNSDESFDPNNFQQLIRTCNLKRLFKANAMREQNIKYEKKFTEEVSYPSGNYYRPNDANDRTLIFESRFESGNLQLVHKKSDTEYDLVLQNDINSKGHTQWFYFRVANVKRGQKVKFNMLNMIKSKSLYTEGMKVMYYSEKRQENLKKKTEHKGWCRGGEDYSYFQNNFRKENQPLTQTQRCYFTFTFTFTFDYDDDMVYFAYSQPYTYTDLVNDLNEISAKKLNYISRNTLCRTIAGNKCEYLTISNRVPVEVDRKKQGVIITARVHPGESNSSWMMKGVIDFLISDDPKAVELRNKFIFKVIPMLNPDGVINGNYRCSLAGCDLNRRWKYPSEVLHPTIYYTKKLIKRLANDRPLALYCDLHGHSRRKNVFLYGNTLYGNPESTRIFPFLMSKVAQPNFSYDYSKFNVCKTKEHTARIAMWRELNSKVPNIFTLEASFCGPKPVRLEPHRERQPYAAELNYHFNTNDLKKIGNNLCETLLLYKQAEESSMGIQNLEFEVQQFQIKKQNMLELDEIIKQQKEEEKKQYHSSAVSQSRTPNEQQMQKFTQRDQTKDKEKEGSVQKSNKKPVSKNKTDKTVQMLDEFSKNGKLERPMDKKKVKYNLKDAEDTDAQSDSEPSDDNLDENDIMKLLPKKFGKAKYLKGVMEKKKPVIVEEKKEVKKKPKATLMPCMSSSKKEREKQAAIKESSNKKQPYVQKTIVTLLRKGGTHRDVGTQIPYNSDGKNLSLMELDILQTTGCKWSKIIYPGFKGVRPSHHRESYMSAERLIQDCFIRNGQEHRNNFTTPTKQTLGMSNFKELRSVLDRKSLNNSNQKEMESIQTSSLLKNVQSANVPKNNNFTTPKQKNVSPFMNEIIKQASQHSDMSNDGILNSLQKRIQDAQFNEPRSLFGGQSNNKNNIDYQMFFNEKDSSAKKNQALNGLPSFQYHKQSIIQKFDLGELETVQEKVKPQPLYLNTQFERGSLERKKRQPSIITQQSITKKVMNGEIVKQMQGQMLPKVVDKQQLSGTKPRNKSLNSQGVLQGSASKNDTRLSFQYAAHHMLNESQSIHDKTLNFSKFETNCDLKNLESTPKNSMRLSERMILNGPHVPQLRQMKSSLFKQSQVHKSIDHH